MEYFLIFSFALTQKKQKVKAARSTLLHGVFSYLFFCLDAKETKSQGCTIYATTWSVSAKEKELAALKQLFLFNAPHSLIS